MENSLKNKTLPSSVPDTGTMEHPAQQHQRNVTFDALVLDAKLRQSLVTVRSLGRHNKKVAALEVANALELSRHVPAFASRWCQRSSVAPSFVRDVEPFLTYLQQWLDNTGARVLITSSDGTLAVLREHRARIEQHGAHVALAGEPALSIALNKDQTLEIAEKLGLGIPRGVMLRSVDEVTEAVRDVGLPAVVKPAETWQWGEQRGMRLISILVTTPEEARQAVEKLTQNAGVVLFQKFLTGRREAVSFMYAHGEIYARFAQWAMRTHPQLGGTSVYRQSIPVPKDIGEQAERLVREIELDGYSEVEFRRDHLGKPYLMEINPRLSASVEVATRAGVDFPYLLYQWANGEPIDHVEGYLPGGWMRYLEGDILATVQSFINRGRPEVTPPVQALYEFLSAFFIPTGYDYVDWQDLAPASHAVYEFMDRVWYKLGKRS
jgi:predicted ATP-grasp superfamily ATP-dependent carboligase